MLRSDLTVLSAVLCFVSFQNAYSTRVTSYFATNEFNVKPTPVIPIVYTTEIVQEIKPTRIARSPIPTRLPSSNGETYHVPADKAKETPAALVTADSAPALVPAIVASEVLTTGDLSSLLPTTVLQLNDDFKTRDVPLPNLTPPKA